MAEENGLAPEQEGPMHTTIEVPPGMVPTQYIIDQATMGPQALLVTVLSLYTPVGVHITFWPEASAEVLGKELMNSGRMTKGGLHLPRRRA